MDQVWYETAAVQKYSALYVMLFVSSATQFWVQFCHFCTLSVMLAHYSSNRFIQRPNLVVLHASITLVVDSPSNSVDVFY